LFMISGTKQHEMAESDVVSALNYEFNLSVTKIRGIALGSSGSR
jgi:hypothetical protein